MPCSGRSIDATTKQASANESAMARACVRLPLRPCWTITTGQPAVGLRQPAPPLAVAFGTVTSSGIVNVARVAGIGLNRVMKRLVWSSGAGGGPAASQNVVRIAAVVRVGGAAPGSTAPASCRRRCSALPCSAALACWVVSPVACTPIGCAGTVAASASKLSSIDCVEKLQLSTTRCRVHADRLADRQGAPCTRGKARPVSGFRASCSWLQP